MVYIHGIVDFVPHVSIAFEFHQNSNGCHCCRWSNTIWMLNIVFPIINSLQIFTNVSDITWAIFDPYFDIELNNAWATEMFGLYNGGMSWPVHSLVSCLKVVENIFNTSDFSTIMVEIRFDWRRDCQKKLEKLFFSKPILISNLNFHRIWIDKIFFFSFKGEQECFYFRAVQNSTETANVQLYRLYMLSF